MNCLGDEILRARIDGELSSADAQAAGNHLATCAACRERAQNISSQAAAVHELIAGLAPSPDGPAADAALAYAQFKTRDRAARPAEPSPLGWIFARRFRPAWGAAALALAIVFLVSFAPARTWAQKILSMFRAEKIAVVPVDLGSLRGPDGETTAGKMLGQMISNDMVVTVHGQPQVVADRDEASRKAGFKVLLLGTRTDPPRITVAGEQAFHMTVNRERAQSILDEAGRSDLILPDSLDGATVAVQIPPAVLARYGPCPGEKPAASGGSTTSATQPSADFSNCLVLGQVPSPIVSVPQGLDVGQIVEIGLQVGGMSAQQAHEYCQTVDWTTTLVLPLPSMISSYQKVNVDGVEGTLINLPRFGPNRQAGYNLIWLKGGIIYSLMGFGDSANAAALAETLN